MNCEQIMKTDIECVSPETTVRDVARRMRDHQIGFLPVCDEFMRPLGAVTDRDLALRVLAEDRSAETEVSTVMTSEVVACRPEDDLEYARELMAQRHKSRIMCVSRAGRLEGIISLSDIAQRDERSGAATLRQVSEREARD